MTDNLHLRIGLPRYDGGIALMSGDHDLVAVVMPGRDGVAAQILRAVNSHAALLAACKRAIEDYESAFRLCSMCERTAESASALRAAIAAAEKQP